jgi:hypothetical protein
MFQLSIFPINSVYIIYMNNIQISIGPICGPRFHIKNNYMTRENGYKTCPFDICITTFHALIKCIEENFEHFFDNLHLIDWSYAPGNRIESNLCANAITNGYGMIFNHEGSSHSHLFKDGKDDDEYYSRNNYEEFKKRYIKRIQNFKNYMNENKDIILITTKGTIYDYSDIEISELTLLLNNKYKDKNFKIIFV